MSTTLLPAVRGLIGSHSGVTVVEYSILVALIAVSMVAALGPLGEKVQAVFVTASNAMN